MWKGYFSLHNENKLDKFLKEVIPYARDRLRQVDDSPNTYTVRVEFEIN